MKLPQFFFSIVIPTLNEEKYLPRLLEDLSKQVFTNFEVIHVDGNSDDKTLQVAKKFSPPLHMKMQTLKDRNVSKQRNLGATLATGKWVIFMDADNRLSENFLLDLSIQLNSSDCHIFTCYMDDKNIPIPDRPIIILSNIWLKISSKIKPFAPGALIGVKSDFLNRVQFDEGLYLSEDFEFVQQAVQNGLHFMVFEQPKYIYSLRRLKKEGSLKIFRVYAKAQINFFLTDQKITKPLKDYPMNGGNYYDSVPKISVSKIQHLIESSSKTQINKVKSLIQNFSDF